MTNDQVYAAGLLSQALHPATQPEAIRAFLRAEEVRVRELVPRRGRVVDFGCGMGRHLIGLRDVVALGVGIDYEWTYIAEANRLTPGGPLHFLVADATRVPLRSRFDAALCLANTWGTMSDKLAVLGEMRRLAPATATRLITVYASTSVSPRRQWYANLGHEVVESTAEHLRTSGGFPAAVGRHREEERTWPYALSGWAAPGQRARAPELGRCAVRREGYRRLSSRRKTGTTCGIRTYPQA